MKNPKLILTTILLIVPALLMGAFENVELEPYNLGHKVVAADAADIDHDGDLDFVVVQVYNGQMQIMRNDGSGLTQVYYNYMQWFVGDAKFIDFDGDGWEDLVYSTDSHGASGPGLYLMRNNQSGGFINVGFIANSGSGPYTHTNGVGSIDAGDYDGDGDQDLLIGGSRWNQRLIVLENDGTGNFTEDFNSPWGNGQTNDAVNVQFADFDADGDPDIMLLAQNWDANNPLPMVWENTGSGFQPAYTESAPGVGLWGRDASVADMDGDGDLDILAQGNGAVLLYENTGAFTFTPHTIYDQTSQSQGGVRAADFDYDGDMDIVTTTGTHWGGTDNQRLMIMENVGGLSFIPGFEGSQNTGTLATIINAISWVGDAEGDGDLEVLTGEYYSGYLWGFNSPPPEVVCTPEEQTFTILGANGSVGDIDPYSQALPAGATEWQPAYLTGWHPWGFINGTNSWVNYDPNNAVGLYTRTPYRIRFEVPEDYTDPSMVFQLKADNRALVWINDTFIDSVDGGGNIIPADAVVSQALHTGVNEIRLMMVDWGGIVGFNYRIDVTMTSCEDITDAVLTPDEAAELNNPPLANAGLDQTSETTSVSLDGSLSSDPDENLLIYSWSEGGNVIATGVNPTINLTDGPHTITLTVSDGELSDTDELIVEVVTNTPPTADAGEDQSIDCVVGSTDVTLSGLGSDADGDDLTYSWSDGSSVLSTEASFTKNLGGGNHSFTLTVSDGAESASDDVSVTVNLDETDPVLTLPDNFTMSNDPGLCGAEVAFSITATDECSGVTIVSDPESGSFLNIGTTVVNVTATDAAGNVASSSFDITVEDTEAPTLVAVADPTRMWPPNHKYRSFDVSDFIASVSDNCTDLESSSVMITHVTSDEVEDVGGGGDGNTHDDMSFNNGGLDLRAERQGGGNGRVYTVYLEVSDEAGNSNTASYQVHVPHSKKSSVVDDGAVYSVYNTGLAKSFANEENDIVAIPTAYVLQDNFPNPFNPSTTISYGIPEDAMVSLRVFDMRGSLVSELAGGYQNAGSYQVNFQASHLSSGTYIYVLEAGSFKEVKRMVYLK